MSVQPRLTGLPSVNGSKAAAMDRIDAVIESRIPDTLSKLSPREKKIWRHVTEALLEYGLIHRTDAMLMHIIVKTYIRWEDAEVGLDKYAEGNSGSYIMESGNGYMTPHPLYYVARDQKKDLMRYLPEACLTIISFNKVQAAEIAASAQGTLFDDPVAAFKAQKAEMGIRRVK